MLALSASVFGCFATPRIEDSSAPRDYYAAATKPAPRCEPAVELVRSMGEARRPFREVANLSASCYPGVPGECERQLLRRGCELRADAIILTETKAGGVPLGASTQSRISRSGIAVRWSE